MVCWIPMLFVAGLIIWDGSLGPDHSAYALIAISWTLMLGPVDRKKNNRQLRRPSVKANREDSILGRRFLNLIDHKSGHASLGCFQFQAQLLFDGIKKVYASCRICCLPWSGISGRHNSIGKSQVPGALDASGVHYPPSTRHDGLLMVECLRTLRHGYVLASNKCRKYNRHTVRSALSSTRGVSPFHFRVTLN